TWRNIAHFCEEQGLQGYGPEEEGLYLEARGLTGGGLDRRQVDELRQVKTLLAAGSEGAMPPRRPWREGVKVPERFAPVYDAYRLHLEGRGLRPATVASNLKVVKGFLAGLGTEALADVDASDVAAHVERVGSGSPQGRALVLYDVRAFARWASGEGLMSPAVAAFMPVIPDHSRSELPSAYSPAEVAAAVGAPGAECPRRNRAMMLCMSTENCATNRLKSVPLVLTLQSPPSMIP
ncbi:MAG: hypothetical protein IKG69_11155, partial [Atopobiaceae bacterium]|nr:hypothetical protein [Atopobiaceae bacterium]